MKTILLTLLVTAVCAAHDLPAPDQVVVEPDQLSVEAHRPAVTRQGMTNQASSESLALILFIYRLLIVLVSVAPLTMDSK